MATAATEKHPKGLYVLFGSEMWERFSFYTVNAMLALYLRDTVQGFSFTNAEAANVQSWYLMFVYFTPLLGGLLADLFLGFRKAILIGAAFFIAGHALLAVPDNLMIVYAALGCLVIGNGFFKPNVSSMVGNLYSEGSHLKDKAYLIFYMGINVGAALAPIVAGFIQPRWGFHPAFFMGAIGMVISVIIFSLNQKHVRHADRIRGKSESMRAADAAAKDPNAIAVTEDLPPVLNEEARNMAAVPEWKRIVALIVIFLIVIVFWMIFHQNSLTLTFWAEDHTQWTFIKAGGILSNAINAIWIVVLSLPLAWFWGWLDKRGLEPSTPTKIMYGMALTGVSMVILYFAAVQHGFDKPAFRVEKADASGTWVSIAKEAREHLAITVPATPIQVQKGTETVTLDAWRVTNSSSTPQPGDFVRLESHDATQIVTGPTTKASLWWLILMYGVISLGELMLSPMGLALVSKVAPIRMRGLMMGGWFAATAIGNKLTGIGKYWDLWSHSAFFIFLAGLAFVMAVVLFLLLRPLKKAMPGV
ncbi:MAG: peptide MFS transporter [Acidobacteriota bacterium]|nr:peptide MFS transporter [Acidobacteriota bacterium]